MDVSKHYIHIINTKQFKSGGTTYLIKAKTTAKNLKIATKNHVNVQSKRTQQSDGVITIAGNKQKLWKAARKKLWAHQKLQNYQNTKLQNNVYYFNQPVEPAYSTDDVSQNSGANKSSNKCLNSFM